MNATIEHEYKNFVIRKLCAENIADFCNLFFSVFGKKLDEQAVINKHLNCDGPTKYLGFLAYDKLTNEPASYYGVFPSYISYHNQQYLCVQSGDVMTHPQFQKQGLFVQLATITFEYCKSIGIDVMFAMPNEQSLPLFLKHLNFQQLSSFQNLSFIENRFELNRVFSKSKVGHAIQFAFLKLIIKLCTSKGDTFENSNQLSPALAYLMHTPNYFQLKDNSKNLFVKINNVNIWLRITQYHIIIVDMSAGADVHKTQIINRLRLITKLSGFRFLAFGATPNTYLLNQLTDLSITKSKGYNFVALNLSTKIPVNDIALLNADADVF
jgi:GNAT superfamily N-acetyltransferase